jgi:phosphate transport system protein
MENHFEAGLEELRRKKLMMANRAEAAVNDAVQSLMQRNRDLAVKVRADDDAIDQFEMEIDGMAIQLLTKAPLASNLRLVTVTTEVSLNLERIGDEATKIANRARDLSQEPPVNVVLDLPRLAGMALAMAKDALDALVQCNSAAARAIVPRDGEIHALNRDMHAALAQHMKDHPDAIERCLH